MKFTQPTAGQVFTAGADAQWPEMVFRTDATGAHTWQWTIKWGPFSNSGTATTAGNEWNATSTCADRGGMLTVVAKAGTAHCSVAVTIKGSNPSEADVVSYLATQADSAGFDAIIGHESKYKHFNAQGAPVKSFDNGYGMCQLTTPVPTYDQVWNWKKNVSGGLKLFSQKRAAAIAYLKQAGRSYTAEQLKYETVCRWNGGAYHDWSTTDKAWVRKAGILCDSATGNIGWDMSDAENKGKTEAALRQRDKASYSKAPEAGAHWGYFGVCYADRVLG